MEFEGFQFAGPDDVVRYYKEGGPTRPRDEFPDEWLLRFAGVNETARRWVDEALCRLIVERGGAELAPDQELGSLVNLASLINSRELLPLLRARLARGIEGWTDERAASFLQWLISARAAEAEVPLAQEELDRIEALGARPGGFSAAGSILGRAAPWRLPGFARAHAAEADRDRAVYRLAFEWAKATFAPYRLELLQAVPESLRESLRKRLEAESRFPPGLDLEGVFEAAWDRPERQTAVFAGMVARAWFEGGAPTRRALLLHRRDGADLRLPRLDRVDDAVSGPAHVRVESLGEPIGRGATFSIPVTIQVDGQTHDERIRIHRHGDRFKVALRRR